MISSPALLRPCSSGSELLGRPIPLFLALACLGTLPSGLAAQVDPVTPAAIDDATLLVEGSDSSVWLRWSLPGDAFPDGPFIVERTDPDGTVHQVTVASPMPEAEVFALGLMEAEEYAEFVQTFSPDPGLGPEEAEAREFNRAVLTLATFSRPAWARVLGTLYEDTEVTPGASYTYRVSTTVAGAPVVVGEEVSTVADAAPLVPVQGLEGEADEGGINLRWTLAREGWVVGYRVRRMDPDGSQRELAEDGVFVTHRLDPESGMLTLPDVFLHDDEVEPNSTYAYSVVGVNVFGRLTPPSEWVSVFYPDPEPLEVPVVSSVDVGDRQIELSWAPPADERVVAMAVVRTLDPLHDPEVLTPELLPPSANRYLDTEVDGGVSYYYGLVSLDAQGRQFGPSALRAARAVNLSPPSAPRNLQVEPTEESLILSWDPVSESDLEGYQLVLLRGDGEGAEEGVLLTPELLTEPRHELPVPPGTLDELHLAVRAVNSSFVEGPLSAPVRGRILDVVPPAPPLLEEVHAGEGQISVSWAPTTDPDVAEYRVLRRVQGDGEEDFQLLRTGLSPDETRLVDREVTPGLLHAYTVEAVDASGNVSERASPLAATPYRLSRPEPPQGLVVRPLPDGGIHLVWDAATDQGVLFWVVEREASGGRWIQVGDPLLAAVREFTDPRGRSGHAYRVVAVDVAGVPSEPSQEVRVPE
jgi:hypothetical protein